MKTNVIYPKRVKSATFNEDKTYRYELRRVWSDKGKGLVNFIGLNPSTADSMDDDPTIRRCIGFAQAWGYDGLIMTNLFAYRATQPADLWRAQKSVDVIGPLNLKYLELASKEAAITIAAWGADKGAQVQGQAVIEHLQTTLYALALSKKTGAPRHPLYLKADLTPALYFTP